MAVVGAPPDNLGQGNNVALRLHAVASIVFGTIASAVAAWEASRSRRHGVTVLERSASRGQLSVLLRVELPVFAWAALAYLGAQSAVQVRSMGARVDWPDPTIIVLTLCLIAALTAWGVVCGAFLPSFVAPLAAALIAYLFAVIQSIYANDTKWARLFPVIQEQWDPAMKPNDWRLWTAVGWLVTMAVVLTAIGSRNVGVISSRPIIVIGVISVLCASSLLFPPTENESFYGQSRSDKDPHTCRTAAGGVVCVYRQDDDQLGIFVDGYASAFRVAGRLRTFPRTLASAGLTGPTPVFSYESYTRPTRLSVAAAVVDFTAAPSFPDPNACPSPPSSSAAGGADWSLFFMEFLHRRGHLPFQQFGNFDVATAKLGKLPLSGQDAWLSRAINAYVACKQPPALP
jgi:hypothetical protein